MKRILFTLFVIHCSLFTFSGCSQDGRLTGLVPAQGVVKFNGDAVANAEITFSPTGDTRPAAAKTDANGKFSLMTLNPNDGIYPGEYTVLVTKTEVVGEYKMKFDDSGRSTTEDTRQYIEHLPVKYGAAATSDVKITIPPKGDKNIEINLSGEVNKQPVKRQR